MTKTKLMEADEIAYGFNGTTERKYWRAVVGGSRVYPEVHFNSRSSMVVVTYRLAHEDFTLSFARTDAAWGDFMAGAYKAMQDVLVGLKAAGLPFETPVGNAPVLRIEYGPHCKQPVVHMANLGDSWPEAEPMPFKVPERNSEFGATLGLDPI